MPKRKRQSETTTALNKNSATNDAIDSSCPVCMEDVCAEMESFPCAHSVCTTCYPRCEVCPICRMGRDGVTDAQRREVRQHNLHLEGLRVTLMTLPVSRTVNYVGGSGGTPLDIPSFTVTGFGTFTPQAGRAIAEAIASNIRSDSERRSGRRMTIGQRQQLASTITSNFAQLSNVIRHISASPPSAEHPTL